MTVSVKERSLLYACVKVVAFVLQAATLAIRYVTPGNAECLAVASRMRDELILVRRLLPLRECCAT